MPRIFLPVSEPGIKITQPHTESGGEEEDDDDVDVTVGLSQVWDDMLYAQLTLVGSAGVG